MRVLIISDIHGNLSALEQVVETSGKRFSPDGLIVLGDMIDYGMRSNEVIQLLETLKIEQICSLWGNHEHAIMTGDFSRFSSLRGISCAQYTKKHLSEHTIRILDNAAGKSGISEFDLCGMKILAVHGNLENPLWGTISPQSNLENYAKYDYVFSGHSHIAHAFPHFYQTVNPTMRNRKRTFFVNPGSVGQPRNHDPRAQYAIWEPGGGIYLCGVDYNIPLEQSLFHDEIDTFYRDRLHYGI